ncbi:MAG TPA: RsmE family RNA methyltransferase [Candidatus Angelobacter sp.]|nr:RsmE family RNA methyltransferase [Candidatus Angelobacter sp.]
MTRRRWIADEVDLGRNRAALLGENAVHLARVLRAKVGQQFDMVLPGGDSTVRTARVTSVADSRVEFDLGEPLQIAPAVRQVFLYLAIFKFDRMEWAIEKVAELGVAGIVPLIAGRTEKHLAAAAERRVERWRRILRQAAQQSRSNQLAEISAPLKLADAVAQADRSAAHIVLAENEKQVGLKDLLGELGNPHQLTIAIGPEGGWTSTELALFTQSGWRSASLGPAILRAETAAIAALSVVLSG